jgi:hypothetical protein
MALTSAEKVIVAEIVQETYAVVDTLATELNAEQESFIKDRLDVWEAIRDSHVKLHGGQDGIDLDNERKREAIRQTIRKALGLSLVAAEVSGYSFPVAHTAVW